MVQELTVRLLQSRHAVPATYFVLVFLYFTYPLGLSDYWWHMQSGLWIWENKALPETDPFSFASSADGNSRNAVILKGFYLGQLLFYFMYSWLGVWGLLLLKASLLTLTMWLTWKLMCHKGVQSSVALILITPVVLVFYRFDELRSVIFSFIGVVLLFYLVEIGLEKLRDRKPVYTLFAGIPILMLVWSNLHRGYPLGIAVLLIFCFSETFKILAGRGEPLQQRQYMQFVSLCGLSVIASLINPNGYLAILENQAELSGFVMRFLDEYLPVWEYAELYDSAWLLLVPAIIVLFCSGYMIVKYRTVDPAHWMLFLGFIYQGFKRYRFSSFMLLMSLAISAGYYRDHSRLVVKKFPKLTAIVLIVSIGVLAGFSSQRTAIRFGPWEKAYFPTEAARYIHDRLPPGNLFNAFEYGGYLGWVLTSRYKVFVDQRCLDIDVLKDYQTAKKGDYREVFSRYGINTVIFYHSQPVLKKIPGVINGLLADENWDLVFIDPVAAVFVRRAMNTGLPAIDKAKALNYILNL